MAISQSDKIWLILDDKLIEGAPEDLMISGAFDHLFNSSAVIFNSEDGTFLYRNESRGSIYVEGKGDKRFWTEKAIARAGFTLAAIKSFPFIEIPSTENPCWKLSFESYSREFSTVYELVSCLKKEVFI
jgi:iron complex transport system ATP-binding protein